VPTVDEIRRAFARKLPLVPRYRQRVLQVPLQLARPVWADDPDFDLDDHLLRTALPTPGGPEELRSLVEIVLSQPLDRQSPLWEAWVVEGLADGQWALISKVHHCMVDGIAGTDVLTRLFDQSADPAPVPPDDWQPHPQPGAARLLGTAVRERLRDPVVDVRVVARAARHLRSTAKQVLATGRGLVGYANDVMPVPSTSLHGHVGTRRRFRWTTYPIADLLEVRTGLGGTLNDVVLAAVALTFRELLLSRGEEPRPGLVRTLVPVSVRRGEQHHWEDNRVSAIIAELPVELQDPATCLGEVSRRLRHLKAAHEAEAGEALTELADLLPPPGVALTLHTAFRVPQWVLTTVTTNVPGPASTLYLCGRRMRATYPYVPVADNVRLSLAVTSYESSLFFGLTGDRSTTGDLDVFAEALDNSLRRLHEAAMQRHEEVTR
jgi:diacylglycerol O-acyltransferase